MKLPLMTPSEDCAEGVVIVLEKWGVCDEYC